MVSTAGSLTRSTHHKLPPRYSDLWRIHRSGTCRSDRAAVIYNPIMDELYTAEKGSGAFCNDRRLRVAARKDMTDCLIGTGIPFIGVGDHGRA